MKFIDDAAVDELAKSSTILQCIVQLLDFECSKFHVQAELVGAENNVALINCDPLGIDELVGICDRVNAQFKRKDGSYSCKPKDSSKTFVVCEASDLSEYHLIN